MSNDSSGDADVWESFEQPQVSQTQTPEVQLYTLSTTQYNISSNAPSSVKRHSDAAPKRIVICCDGTWQSSATGKKNIPSNVTRLARSIARTGRDNEGKVFQQLVYYSSGIGTGDLSLLEKIREGGFGVGLSGDVIEAYNFIVNNYSPGDKILCFGFSRGAYTARSVAGLVTDIGIIRPEDLQDFPDLYEMYRHSHNSHNFRQSKGYREWITGVRAKDGEPGKYTIKGKSWVKTPHKMPREDTRFIEAIGVFDTVGSLGVPAATYSQLTLSLLRKFAPIIGIDDGGFHNLSLSSFIRHAFHALALDEHRQPFSPTLWHYPPKAQTNPPPPGKNIKFLQYKFRQLQKDPKATEERLSEAWSEYVAAAMSNAMMQDDPELLQVWFPGYHMNIGGGNPSILKGEIALISFAWMCEQVRPYLQLDDEEAIPKGVTSTLADHQVEQRKKLIQDSRAAKDYGSNWFTQPAWRMLDITGLYKAPVKMLPEAADYDWALGETADSFNGLMKLAHSKYRTPGEYKKDDAGNDAGETQEQIHPSVHFRFASHPTYHPPSLEGFVRSKKKDNHGGEKCAYEWKKGKVVIPEYAIRPSHNISRRLAEHFRGGKGFVDRLVADEVPNGT